MKTYPILIYTMDVPSLVKKDITLFRILMMKTVGYVPILALSVAWTLGMKQHALDQTKTMMLVLMIA